MGHAYTKILSHLVFSTKNREPLITPQLGPRLHAYMGGITKDLDCPAITIGGVADHVHLLVLMHQSISTAELLRVLKTNSSRWARQTFPKSRFAWQAGYGAFSVSKSSVESVTKYIDTQEAHHRKRSFKDEFVLLLKKHDIEYDARYIWD